MRSILYYPKLHLEENLWLRACTMHFDKIATIVPCRAVRERRSPALQLLAEQGMYEALDPNALFEDTMLMDAFMRELKEDMTRRRMISKQYYTHRKERFDAISRTPSLRKKHWTPFERDELPEYLAEWMLGIGILMEDENGQRWMCEEEYVTQVYYGMMAKYLTFIHSDYMLFGTDILESHVYPFGEAEDVLSDVKIVYMNVLMQRVLPVPAESVPLADIITFRKEHAEELEILDTKFNDYMSLILHCKNVEKLRDITYKYQEELEFALDNFLYFLEKYGMQYKMQSLKLISPIGLHPAVHNSNLKGLKAPVLVTSATRETEIVVQLKSQSGKTTPWSGLERERALYIYDSSTSLISIK